MKKIIFAWAMFLIISLCSIGFLQHLENKNSAEAMPSAEQSVQYTVKTHNGRVAVFVGNEDIPLKYLAIDISYLREYDKKQFEAGIRLDSLKDVLMLEEDFSS